MFKIVKMMFLLLCVNYSRSMHVPQLVMLLNTRVNTVVYRAASAVKNIVDELDFENIDNLFGQALESLKRVIDNCCQEGFHGFPKITRKVVSALYRVSLHTRYHEKLAAASAHLLLVKILTIPNLPEQAYTETVLAMMLLLQDKELQQQLIDSSMRPAGAPVVANSIKCFATPSLGAILCEKISGLIAQLATQRVFILIAQLVLRQSWLLMLVVAARDLLLDCVHTVRCLHSCWSYLLFLAC